MKAISKLSLLLLSMLVSASVFGQAGFPGEYTQNFDAVTSSAILPAGWTTSGTGGLNGVANGSSTTGGFYIFTPNCCSGDHSLGALHSGSATGSYTGTFLNTSGVTITSLWISYDFEQYRSANTSGWTVQVNGVGNSALAASGVTGVTTGVPYVLTKSTTITGLSIAPGGTITVRWTVDDPSGSDNPVAIDNFKMCVPGRAFTVTATSTSPVTDPSPLTFTGGASAGTSPYSYSWAGPSSFSSAASSPILSPTAVSNSGTYTLTVTDNIGCTASATTVVTVNPGSSCSGAPIAGTASATPSSFCASGVSTVSVTGATAAAGITYQWQSSATGAAGSFTNISGATNVIYTTPTISSTTYFRLVTTCTSSSLSDTSTAATLTINPIPSVSATPSGGSICSGGSGLSMTASGATTYTWSPATGLSATTGATITANPTATTTYTITGTTGVCTGTTTAIVNYSLPPSAMTILPSSPTLCMGTTLLSASTGTPGPATVNSGVVTIPGSIGGFGTITNAITMTTVPAGAVITGASVNIIGLGAAWPDDYVINIKAPNGNVLNLVNQKGAHTSTPTAMHSNTNISSSGVTSFASGTNPFIGTFAADAVNGVGGAPYVSNVTNWNGLLSTPNGTWTLSMYNNTSFTNAVITTAQWSVTINYTVPPITWSPTTDLYTDPAATIPYTGGSAISVYYNPSTTGVATYSATATGTACATTASATYTVNPSPAAITGTASVCETFTTSLANATSGGTWSSTNTAVGTVDAAGVVTGIASGTTTISYTLAGGCSATMIVTVNAPGVITGTLSVCETQTTTLNNSITGGTWSSSATTVGTIDASSGILTGISAGTTSVSYTTPAGCIATDIATVNTQPAVISGTLGICLGLTTTLTNAVTGGTWTSSDLSVSTIDIATGIATGVASGTTTISYALPTGCAATAIATVNPLPPVITGAMTVCEAATTSLTNTVTGGTWATASTSTATVDAAGVVTGVAAGTTDITYTLGTGCIATTNVTVNPLPAIISGTLGVCQGLTTSLSDATLGGTWTSSDITVGTIDASGVVTAIAVGTTNITYTLPTGCFVSAEVTVNPLPLAIAGTMAVCEAATTALSDATTGGTWTTGSSLTATVDAAGIVTGVAAGTTGITYTLGTGCIATDIVTVNPLPATIAGTLDVCAGLTTTLSDATTGGTWLSSDVSVATIDASGVVTSIVSGTTNITYTLPTGCYASAVVTVNALPSVITGTMTVCEGSTTPLADATLGGTWSSGTTSVATIDAAGGVTGVSAGTTNITYTLGTGCTATAIVTVLPTPSSITGALAVCEGLTTTLNDVTTGGDWTSVTTGAATIDIVSGVVTGVAAGTSVISYTMPATGCVATAVVTVNALPAPITGTFTVCEGLTTSLSDATSGGTWGSSTPATATIDASGVLTGVAFGTTTVTYTLPTGCNTTAVATVDPNPAAITGIPAVCEGLTTTLTNTTPGGTWSSDDLSVATIVPIAVGTSVVTGIIAGTTNITYTLPAGCTASRTITVNALPAAITGIMTVCELSTTTLNNATGGGTWSSAATATATINTSGVVTGVAAGMVNITYTLGTGCIATAAVTVNALPATITGISSVCAGLSTTLANTTVGGTWTSSNISVAAIDASGLVTSATAGTTDITYTLPTGCYTTHTVTVNPLPGAITGTMIVCETATTTLASTTSGGTWSSSTPIVATVDAAGVVTGIDAGIANITYTLSTGCETVATISVNQLPAVIAGTFTVCEGSTTTLSDATLGGTWSTASLVAGIDPSTGVVNAISAGVATITYTSGNSCFVTQAVTVNALPGSIGGTLTVCEGSQTMLTNTGGGTWTSDNINATIDAATGIATGVTAGTSVITYTLPTGCSITNVVTVHPLPSVITGVATVCAGSTTTLINTGGGTWTSGSTNATVDPATGIVGGVTAGTAMITYTLSTGCATMSVVTVNGLPATIGGLSGVCIGATTTLTDPTIGGTWAISNSNATIDASGVVTGVTVGTSEITYTAPTGCFITRIQTINALPSAISGTLSVCASSATTLTNTGGGTWSGLSSNISVGSSTGIVNGITPGTATVSYTLATGCSTTASVTVNALPSAYLITGGGSYCAGDTGVHIGLSNSALAVNYQLFRGATAIGAPTAGTGSPLDFGLLTIAGTYSVFATNTTTSCARGMTGGATVSINPLIAPSVSIAAAVGTLCAGTTTTFTATPANGGTSPAYQWSVNGINVGTSSTYGYAPLNGDIVSVKLTSNATCATPDTAIDADTLTVMPSSMPTISTTVSPSLHVCAGTTVTFTASETFGGTTPSFVWTKNGVTAATGSTYTYVPTNGDVVHGIMVSNYACRLADTASGGNDTLIVDSSIPPVVGISVNPGLVIAPAQTATFIATVTGGGTPTYQWHINTGVIAGATNSVFTTSTLANNDVVTCTVTSSGSCGLSSFNSVTMKVKTGITGIEGPGVHFTAIPNPNHGTFAVNGNWSNDEHVTLELTNMLGQVVYSKATAILNGELKENITIPGELAGGMYILSAHSETSSHSVRVMIER